MAVEGQQIQMPNEEDVMVFKNHYKELKAPFVIYADFECLTTRTGTVSTKEVKTDKYQHHRPCGLTPIPLQRGGLYGCFLSKRLLK